jgi:hypothetical protein
MKNKALVVAKTNFRNIKMAYVITGIVVGDIVIQDIVLMVLAAFDIFPNSPENVTVSLGNYLYLLVILGAIFIPSRNFRKMMNLGSKRNDFFKGCMVNYMIMAAVISLANIIVFYTYGRMVSMFYGGGILDIMHAFGWNKNGIIVAFFRQFAFLLLFATFVHTLTAMQDKWYGWAADVLIIAIISVFTPIAPLRASLVWFFRLIIFHPNAFLQIAACLILAFAIYSCNRLIFARKAI